MLPSQNNFAFNGSWPFGSSFGSRLGPTGFGLGGGATPPRPTPRVQPSAPNSATVEGIQAAANKQARDEQLADYLERFIKVSLNGNVIPPPPPPGPAPVPPGMAPGGAPSMPPGGPSMPPVGPPMPPGGPGMPPPMPGTAPMPPMPPGGPGGPPGGLPGAPGGPSKRPRARVAPVLDGLLDDKAHEVSDVNVADNMQGQLQSQGHKISSDNPYNELCPECSKPAVRRCRCRIGNFACDNGHNWYRCPEHKDRVLRGTGHGKGFGCHCEEKKEASDLPYRDRVEILPTRNGMVFGGKFKDTGVFGGFGGGIDDGETPEQAAAREFAEEAGRQVSNVRLLGIKPITVDWKPPYHSAKQKERAKQFRGSRTFYATGDLGEATGSAKLDKSPLLEPGEYSFEQAMNLVGAAGHGKAPGDYTDVNAYRRKALEEIQASMKKPSADVEKLAELLERFSGKDQVRALDGRFSHSAKGGPRPPAKVRVTRPESELIKKALQKLAEMKFNLREDDHATGAKAWNIDRFSRKDSDAYGKHKPPVKQASAALFTPIGAGLGYMMGGEQGAMIGAGAGIGAGIGDNLPWLVAALNPKLRGKMLGAASKRLQMANRTSGKYLEEAARSGKVSPRKALGLRIQEHAKIPGDMYAPMLKDPSMWKAYGAGVVGGGLIGGAGTAATLNKSGSFKKEAFGKFLPAVGQALGKAWKAAPKSTEVPAMLSGGIGGMFYGADITGEQNFGSGSLTGMAAGAAFMNPRLRAKMLSRAGSQVPQRAFETGMAGSFAGSGLDTLGSATLGTDTNFGRYGAYLGSGLGAARGGTVNYLKNMAANGGIPAGSLAARAQSGMAKAHQTLDHFGSGALAPTFNVLGAPVRAAYRLAGKEKAIPQFFQATNPTTLAGGVGQVAGYGSLVGMGAGMAYGGLRSSVDDMVQDNVARSYHDVKNHATHELRNALGFGQNGAMSGMAQMADQALAQFGMDPSQYSTQQKIQMLLGTVGGAAGFAGGSPLIGALGMGAAGLPLLTGGANKYNALTDPRNANQMTGKGWY